MQDDVRGARRRDRAGMGAGGAFLIGILRRRLSGEDILRSLLESTRTTAAVFTILIGVGPRTLPDIAYHAAITTVLIVGLLATARERQALAA